MSNNFLGIGGLSNLTDGTTNIYARSLRVKNLIPNSIVKTSSTNTLIAVDTINISEVAGLQTELNDINNDIKSVITNPIQTNLNMAGFNIINANNITGQAPNSAITINDDTVNIQGTTIVNIGTSTGTARLNAFDTVLTTTGVNPVQCLRGLNMSSNALTNVTGITMTGATKLITDPILNNASNATNFNMNGFNILGCAGIFGVAGNSTLTIQDEIISVVGATSITLTSSGFVRLNGGDTILTTTGANAVQCLRNLDMKTNNIINVNNLLANTIETQDNIYLYKSIAPDIYVNASLMSQRAQIIYNGIALTPAGGNTFQFAPSFIPTSTASNIRGSTFIPANTMAVGNTFKLSCYGTTREGNNGIIQNFRLYALNTVTITPIQLISISNTESVTTLSRWKLDIVFQIRAIGISASMVINGDLAIGNTNQSITNILISFDSTVGQQLLGTIYFDTNNINNTFTTDISSLTTL